MISTYTAQGSFAWAAILIVTGAMGISAADHGQFPEIKNLAIMTNPQIMVEIERPPGLALAIEHLAISPTSGPCAGELINQVQQLFLNRGARLIGPQFSPC